MANRRGKGGSSDRFPLGLQNHCGCECSHEIRIWLFLGRKAMTNLDSVLKSRDITLLTKVCIVRALVFREATYSCESWTIKKAERQRTEAFEMWCWRRLLNTPWTARRPNNSLNIHWKNWCWSWSSSILATRCEEPTHWERPWRWERLRAGEGGNRRWNDWMVSPTQWTRVWANSGR